MSNNSNLSALAAALDDGTSGQVLQSTGSGGVQFADSTGSGVTVHANQAAMLTDAASADEGTLHYETGTNKLYVKQSSGFYLLASITNASPTIDSFSENTGGAGANNLTAGGTFTLTAGSNTVVTINATEPDLETISYSATVTSGTATDVFSSPSFPVTNQSSNVFTLTPVTSGSGGTVTIRFDASDGTNVANVTHSFEIAFVIADSHYTTLLMATDGSAGGNSTITYDTGSSTGNNLTEYGDVHAGTFSPYRHGGYSTYFDGSGDYLSLASSTDFTLDGNFTIDFWVNILDSNIGAIVSSGQSSFVSGASALIWDHGTQVNKLSFWAQNISSTSLVATNTLDLNRWYFISVVRDNGVITIYQDGASVSTYNSSSTISLSASGMRIGAYWNGQVNAYITDFRIVKGTPITPASGGPTERLTAVTNTSLLTCHLPYFADGSSSAHSITVNGDPETKPFGPYDYNEYSESTNGGSVYFDGNDDLSATLSSAIGTGDFSISGWYYTGATPTTYHRRIFTIGGNNNANGMSFLHQTSGVLRLRIPANVTETHNYSYKAGQWVYFCIKRSSGTLTLHINGEQEYSGSDSTNLSSTSLCVGNDTIVLTSVYGIDGSVADFKISTSSIEDGSVPTSVVSSSGSILHLKGTDAHVIDKSQVSNLKLVGNAAASTTQAKFSNTASVYFDGDADEIAYTVPTLSGDFTFEAFIYPESQIQSFPICFTSVWDATAGNRIVLSYDTSTDVDKFSCRVGSNFIVPSSTSSTGQWYHLAVVRSGSTVSMYIDGIRIGTQTYSGSISSRTGYIGGNISNSTGGAFKGYIQDFRVTNGLARYTAADESSNIPSAPLKG